MSDEFDTSNVIGHLVTDLSRPGEASGLSRRWKRTWAASALAFAAITLFLAWNWPEFVLTPAEWMHPGFLTRAALWLTLFALTANLAFRSVVPLISKRDFCVLTSLTVLALILATWSLRTDSSIATELRHELDWGRGPCGFFIAIAGVTAGLVAMGHLRAGASVGPLASGFWSGVAAGALGCFFMHLICRHETTAHVFLWHVLPIAGLATLTSLVGRRLLFPT